MADQLNQASAPNEMTPPVLDGGCAPRWPPAAPFSTVCLLQQRAPGKTEARLQHPPK